MVRTGWIEKVEADLKSEVTLLGKGRISGVLTCRRPTENFWHENGFSLISREQQ